MFKSSFNRWLKKTFSNQNRQGTSRRQKRGFLPKLEQFEDRIVPAYNVTSPALTDTPGTLVYGLDNSQPTINFDLATPTTITLSSRLTLDYNVSIGNVGAPVTLSGGGTTGIFFVNTGVTASLSGLSLIDGSYAEGGAVENFGNLTVTDCTFSGNSADYGAGIASYIPGATLTVAGSTFYDNTSGFQGGAIGIDDSAGNSIKNSTFYDNAAVTGGAVQNSSGTLNATDDTFFQNQAYGSSLSGGGLYLANGTLTLHGDILVGNKGDGNADDLDADLGTVSASSSYNMYGVDNTGVLSEGTGNFTETSASAKLAPFNYYGGPTETFALLPGSPAIEAGYAGGPSTDQRGFTRNTDDVGAFAYLSTSSLVVNTSSGSGSAPSGDLSLTAAVNLVDNAGNAPNPEITFAADYSIDLASGLTLGGGGTSFTSVSITGPSTIEGGGITNPFSVFTVDSGVTASLSDLTISGGYSSEGGGVYNASDADLALSGDTFSDNTFANSVGNVYGGAVYNAGTLTSIDDAFTGNSISATGVNHKAYGGAIYNAPSASMSSTDDSFTSNTSTNYGGAIFNGEVAGFQASGDTFSENTAGNHGGAIFNSSGAGNVTIKTSTFTDNGANQGGGGIFTNNGTVTIEESYFTENNAANGAGGAIYNTNSGKDKVTNNTFYENTAGAHGGDVNAYGGAISNNATMSLTENTFVGNSAAKGGGLYVSGSTYLYGNILVGNLNSSGGADDINGNEAVQIADYNLIGAVSPGLPGVAIGNVSVAGTGSAAVANALLSPTPQFFGGPTETFALVPGSPAEGAGLHESGSPYPEYDQRGQLRPASGQADIGAFQLQGSLIVDTPTDPPSGAVPFGELSLRQAINIIDTNTSNTNSEPDLEFAASYDITLLGSGLTIDPTGTAAITINAPVASPSYVPFAETVSGNSLYTIFTISSDVPVTFNDITLEHGKGVNGAAIDNNDGGSLTVTDATFLDNTASGEGGAIYSSGPLTIDPTLFTGNKAGGSGGAIYASGTLSVDDGTFNTNSAGTLGAGSGGAVAYVGTKTANFTSGTFFNNTAKGNGGGVYASTGALSFAGTTSLTFDSATIGSGGGVYAGGALTQTGTGVFNSDSASMSGGGIYGFGTVTINNALADNDTASGGSGGGIYAGSTLTQTGTGNFIDDSAKAGGGIYGVGTVTINNAAAVDDTASGGSGGGVYAGGALNQTGTGVFSSDSASMSGGGIYGFGTVTINNATADNDTASGGSGGGIYAGSTLTQTGSGNFFGDLASGSGGGIYGVAAVTLNDAAAVDDTASGGSGGGIYAGSTLTQTSTGVFNGDSASVSGGGIYGAAAVTLNDADADGDTASGGSGGGIYAGLAFNQTGTGEFFSDSASGSGGGIYGVGTVTINNAVADGDTASGGSGGGVYAGSTLTQTSTGVFNGDSASVSGGGIYGAAAVTINNATADGDTASGGSGGGVYAGAAFIQTGTAAFNDDKASVSGGGIYGAAAVTITSASADNDTAMAGNGGGIYAGGALGQTLTGNFSGDSASVSGGGIYGVGTVTLNDATADGDTASGGSGGGVYAGGALGQTLTGNFSGDSASVSGGGIYGVGTVTLNDITADGDTASGGSGGGVYAGAAFTQTGTGDFNDDIAKSGGGIYGALAVTITSAAVNSDSATAGNGGGIYAGGALSITDSELDDDQASESGGGAYGDADVTINDASFDNDTALGGSGGGLYAAGETLQVEDGSFTSDIAAAGSGGGIAFVGGSAGTITGGIFHKNHASVYGGGIYTSASSLIVKPGATFSKNTANAGGGIYAGGKTLKVTDGAFTSNAATAGNGGGIAFVGTKSVAITGGSFHKDTATGNGGGIYLATGTLTVSGGTTFTQEKAGEDGGGIYSDGTGVKVTEATFKTNSAAAGVGGAIGFSGTGKVSATSASFLGNTAHTLGGGIFTYKGSVSVDSVYFAGNSGTWGGAIYVNLDAASSVTLTTTTSQFTSNTATDGDGGAIYAEYTLIKVSDSTFNMDSAYAGGGILQVDGSGTSTLTNDTFNEDVAGFQGGGVWNSGALSATDDTFYQNTAGVAEGGAGLYTVGSTLLNGDLLVDNLSLSTQDDLDGTGVSASSSHNLVGTDNTQVLKLNVNNQVLNANFALAGVNGLANNGGPTVGATGNTITLETDSLAVNSYALGKGLDVTTDTSAPGADERGVVRPGYSPPSTILEGGIPLSGLAGNNQPGDVGAFQFSNPPLIPTTPTNGNPVNASIIYSATSPPPSSSYSASFTSIAETDIYNNGTTIGADTTSVGTSVQWQISTDDGQTFTNIQSGGLYGTTPTSATLVINASDTATDTALAALNGDEFRAVYTNPAGQIAITTAATLTVNYAAPTITTELPATTTFQANNATPVTLTAAATGVPTPTTVQWYYSTNGGISYTAITGNIGTATVTGFSSGTLSSGTLSDGIESSTLSITNAPASFNGYLFEAEFTNALGSATTTPEALDVQSAPQVGGPSSQTVAAGGTVTFATTIASNPAVTSITWSYSTNGGSSWTLLTDGSLNGATISGSATDDLTVSNVPYTFNGYDFQETVENGLYTTESAVGTLTVDYAPIITTQPTSQTYTIGTSTSAVFTSAVTWNPTGTVQWFYNNGSGWTALTDGADEGVLGGASVSGSATGTLTLSTVPTTLNGYKFEAVYTNTFGSPPTSPSTTTNAATLIVDYAPIVSPPSNQTYTVGTSTSAIFTASDNANPAASVLWYYSSNGGSNFTALTDGVVAGATVAGSATNTLTLTNVPASYNGYEFEAKYTNTVGTVATTPATLTVDYAPIVSPPSPVTYTVGTSTSAVFTSSVNWNPTGSVVWEYSNGGSFSDVTSNLGGATFTGLTGDTLTITNIPAGALNGYEFEAVYTNSVGTVASTPATLTVDYAPIVSPPSPVTYTIGTSTSAIFSASDNANPGATVLWYYSSNNGSSFTALTDGVVAGATVAGSATNTLTITNVPASYNGYEFEAKYTNTVGTVATTPATLTVDYAPIITTQPQSVSVNIANTSTASFTAAANANPALNASNGTPPGIQWEYSSNGSNFQVIPGTGGTGTLGGSTVTGINSGTLNITGLTTSALNGYEFEAIFTNSIGSTTTLAATLTVGQAPFITTQPPSTVDVLIGQNTSFSAYAGGSPAPSIQWEYSTDGGTTFTPIGNGGVYGLSATTNTLTITDATAQMNGYVYEAYFSNGINPPVVSSTVALTVGTVPAVTANPVSDIVNVGGTATFTAAATGSPTPTVQWQYRTGNSGTFTNVPASFGTATVSGATSNTLTITGTTAALNDYQFQAVYTNVFNSEATSAATLNTLGIAITQGSYVLLYDTSSTLIKAFQPFGNSVTSMQVTLGNLLNTGSEDIVVAGGGTVEVYNGQSTVVETLTPYGASWTKGLNIAVGNVLSTNTSSQDLVVAPAAAGKPVEIYSGTTLETSFVPFPGAYPGETYTGGLHVAAGNFFGTGQDAIAVGTANPQSGVIQLWNYSGGKVVIDGGDYGPLPGKGLYVAAGSFTVGSPDDLIIGSGTGTTAHLYVINAVTHKVVASLPAGSVSVFGGGSEEVRVGVLNANGTGPVIVAATGVGATQEVQEFDLSGASLGLLETLSATQLGLTSLVGYNDGIYVG